MAVFTFLLSICCLFLVSGETDFEVNFHNNGGCNQCGDSCSNNNNNMRTFTILHEVNFPPFAVDPVLEEGADTISNQGFTVDVIKAAGTYGGCNIAFSAQPWSNCITPPTKLQLITAETANADLSRNVNDIVPVPDPANSMRFAQVPGSALNAGNVDGCGSTGVTDIRKAFLAFSDPYATSTPGVIAVAPESPITSLGQINTIGLNSQSFLNEASLRSNFGSQLSNTVTIVEAPMETEGFAAGLTDGSYDAIYMSLSRTTLEDFRVIDQHPGPQIAISAMPQQTEMLQCINKGLAAMKNNNEYTRICNEWQARVAARSDNTWAFGCITE